jgi:transcription initiation factor TFIIIB Brf1 subunit/transcription initiation factor TFIIB
MKNRSKEAVIQEIEKFETNPMILELAKRFLEEMIQKRKGNRVHFNDATAPALVYLAYRKAKIPKMLDEIAETEWDIPELAQREWEGRDLVFISRKARIGREFKRIKEALGMKICVKASLVSPNCLLQTTPDVLIDGFAGKLKLSDKTKVMARKLLKKCENECSGMKPSIIAGITLLIAGTLNKERRTQREVADVIDATEVSVRNGINRIFKNHPDLEDEFTEKLVGQQRVWREHLREIKRARN